MKVISMAIKPEDGDGREEEEEEEEKARSRGNGFLIEKITPLISIIVVIFVSYML